MVDEVITKQELIDAQRDAQSLDDFINGSDEQIVVTRLLKEYPTLANAIRQIYEKGGKFYPTLAAANADIANIRTDVYVITGNNGAYYKATAGATTLTKSAYDPLTQAKSYADANPNFKIKDLIASDSLDIRYEGKFNIPSDAIATVLGTPENKAGVMLIEGKNGTLSRTYRIINSDKEYFSYSNGAGATSENFAWSAFTIRVRTQDISTAKSEAITNAVNQSAAYTDGTTYQDKGRLTTEHLDTLLSRGIWVSNSTVNATLANGYPWEGVSCVITNKKTSSTATLLQVAESIEATNKRTATRRHNGTSWGQWNTGEAVQFSQLDADVKNKVAPKGTWIYPDDTVCTFDKATRTLSWDKTITLATRNVTQNRVNFSAGSIDLSTALDYTIIYLDLTLLPTDGSTVTNPASCIKFGTYNQFVDDITKLPIAVMRSATGNVVSKNGFMPIINGSGGGTSSSDGSSTIEFNKTATALEFYVKGGGANMIKHQLVHAVMPDIQLDNWGMTTAMEVDSEKNNVKAITSNGVWECALKDSENASDHSGGSHGDELKTSAFFLVDGVYKAEDFVLSGKAKEIKFVQKSVIYAQESTIKIADRQVEWTFAAEKLNMKQTVTPVAGRTFTSTWVLMLPVLRKSNTNNTGIQITDKEIRSFDWSVIDVSEPDFVRREIVCKKGHIINLSGQTSGISATIKVNEIESPNPMHFVQNNIQFNKIYVAARTINTSALIAEGEKWVIDADIVISTIN